MTKALNDLLAATMTGKQFFWEETGKMINKIKSILFLREKMLWSVKYSEQSFENNNFLKAFSAKQLTNLIKRWQRPFAKKNCQGFFITKLITYKPVWKW